jgi:hypothetical protein
MSAVVILSKLVVWESVLEFNSAATVPVGQATENGG